MARIRHRYRFAAEYCRDRRVLEVACGAGLGLGYLERVGARVVAGDYTPDLVRLAQRHYGQRVNVYDLDAHALPFEEASFDAVVLFEALYYLQRPPEFLKESARVLDRDGLVILGTVNREWPDFNPSPFSMRYYSAGDLHDLLTRHGFETQLFGAFPSGQPSISDRAISALRRTAVRLRLVPRTMRGKELLKRLFYGRLTVLPPELAPDDEEAVVTPLAAGEPASRFKILYALGKRT